MPFYHTKHNPEMDYFPPEVYFCHQPSPENFTILKGKHHD